MTAAAANLLVSVSSADVKNLTSTPESARIVGLDVSVRLAGYGVVNSYGSGSAARSAAPGYKLVAFVIALAGTGVTPTPRSKPSLAVAVDGGAARPMTYPGVILEDRYYVMSVPATARTVDLLLTDAGMTQGLSLLSGAPGPGFIAVNTRTSTYDTTTHTGRATVRLERNGSVQDLTLTIHVRSAHLEYFTPRGLHPSGPQRAYLFVDLCYQSTGDADPTKCYGFSSDLQLTPTGARPILAKDVGTNNVVYDVFDVPASFTTGTLTVTGTDTYPDGHRTTITRPYSYRINIPA